MRFRKVTFDQLWGDLWDVIVRMMKTNRIEDELEEMSRVVARKLNKLGNGIRDLEQLNESGRVGGGVGGIEERKHNTQQVEAAMQRLKSDLRKRICQVEQ